MISEIDAIRLNSKGVTIKCIKKKSAPPCVECGINPTGKYLPLNRWNCICKSCYDYQQNQKAERRYY